MSIPIGLTVPKLLPITGSFVPAFAAYYTLLSARVVNLRVKQKQLLGASVDATDPLLVAHRAHANFVENVPLALLLGAVVELNGGNRKALTGALAALLALRVVHVEFGLRGKNSVQRGRVIGFLGTLGVVTGFSGWAAYLVKSYWGF